MDDEPLSKKDKEHLEKIFPEIFVEKRTPELYALAASLKEVLDGGIDLFGWNFEDVFEMGFKKGWKARGKKIIHE